MISPAVVSLPYVSLHWILLILKDIKEGGMVVTIYLDPKNHPESTLEILSRLEQGAFGPFYGP